MGALQIRMMNVKAMPTFHNQVGADASRLPPPPPPPPPTLHVTPLAHGGGRKQHVRKAIVVGGAAVVLGVCLVLALTGTSQQAGAEPQQSASLKKSADKVDQVAEPLGKPAADTPREQEQASEQPSKLHETLVTERQAGMMLLEGRRIEALAMYRELANSSKSTPGIEAMLKVLSQKVATP